MWKLQKVFAIRLHSATAQLPRHRKEPLMIAYPKIRNNSRTTINRKPRRSRVPYLLGMTLLGSVILASAVSAGYYGTRYISRVVSREAAPRSKDSRVISKNTRKTNLRALTSAYIATQERATIATDKTDYHPGETVTVSGTGWLPGETVTLVFHERVESQTEPDITL